MPCRSLVQVEAVAGCFAAWVDVRRDAVAAQWRAHAAAKHHIQVTYR